MRAVTADGGVLLFAPNESMWKCYTNMSRKEFMFNYRLSRARSTVERVFGMMKNRFRCIHRKMEYELDNSLRIIKAIAILHNLCTISGDDSELDWDIPRTVYKKPSCNSQTTGGNDVRQALTDYFVKKSTVTVWDFFWYSSCIFLLLLIAVKSSSVILFSYYRCTADFLFVISM